MLRKNKNLIALISVALLLTTLLSACNEIPKDMSKGAYELAVEALKLTDQYLDEEITLQVLGIQLESISDELSEMGKDEDKKGNFIASVYVETISAKYIRGSSREEILELRNELAQTLGKSNRK